MDTLKLALLLGAAALVEGCGSAKKVQAGAAVPSAARSTLSVAPAGPVTADGVSSARLTLQVRDASGLAVPGVAASLQASGSHNTLAQPGPTDATGSTSAMLSSTVAEAKVVTATVAGFSLTASVQFALPVCTGSVALGGLPMATTPVSMAALAPARLDGDARADVAALSGDGNFVMTFLAAADGSLAAGRSFSLGSAPGAKGLTLADLNGDGHIDAAVGTATGALCLLGDGAGGLGAPQPVAARGGIAALAAGDFNGDGHADLALVGRANTSNGIEVALGRGDGTFGAGLVVVDPNGVDGAVALDADGDGHLDLATFSRSGQRVSLLLGRGDGTFGASADFALTHPPAALVAGDVNSDGRPDLVAGTGQGIAVLLGGVGGALVAPANVAAQGCTSLALGDVTADGHVDVVTGGATALVLAGDGAGNFVPAALPAVRNVASLWGVGLADVSGDGALDLVSGTAQLVGTTLAVGGRLQLPPSLATSGAGYFPAAHDLDGDGHVDLVVPLTTNSNVLVLRGDGAGHFASAEEFSAAPQPFAAVLEDVSGDGAVDLLTTHLGSNAVQARLGRGDGTFGDPVTLAAASPSALLIVDMDGDGHQDLVTTQYGGNANERVRVARGAGDGTFAPFITYNDAQGSSLQMATADFDGDGRPDVALANASSNGNVLVMLNDGAGGLRSPGLLLPLPTAQYGIVAADVNVDGHPDVVTTGATTAIVALLGRGDGTFSAPVQTPLPVASAGFLFAADYSNDGVPDVLATSLSGAGVTLWISQRDGTFRPSTFASGATTLGAAVADFDGDGRVDAAVSRPAAGGGSLDLYANLGCSP